MGGSSHHLYIINCDSYENADLGTGSTSAGGNADGFSPKLDVGDSIWFRGRRAWMNSDDGSDGYLGTVTYQPGATLVIKNCMSLGSKGVSLPTGSTPTRTYVASNNNFSTATTHPEILSFDTTGVTGMRNVDGSLPNINFMHLKTSAPMPYTYIDKGTILSDVVYHGATGVHYNGATPDLGAFESSYGALPVKMLSFSAYNNNKDVTLNWKMASEINNKGWSIERSSDINDASWILLVLLMVRLTILLLLIILTLIKMFHPVLISIG